MPWIAVTAVVVLDALATFRPRPLLIAGLADEPAHLLTAWLILMALPERVTPPSVWPWVLAASVGIDADHVPQYTWDPGFAVDGGRPPTHGLLTIVLLLVVGAARPCRTWALGLAGGVALHLLRDAATGPGIPLLWPVVQDSFLVAYPLYLVVLILAASVASVRHLRHRRRTTR
jgi:inner membrane protein